MAAGQADGPTEYATRTRTGELRWVESTAFLIPGEDRLAPIMVCMDVEVQVEDQAHSEVDEAQVHAARRAWSLWVGEDSSDEYRTGQTSAIAESLLWVPRAKSSP